MKESRRLLRDGRLTQNGVGSPSGPAPFCCFVVPLTLVFRSVLNDDHRRSELNVTSCIGMIYRIPRRKCAVEHSD